MWRVKEAEEKDKKKTHEALRGATGSGNVAIGPNTGSVTNIGNNNTAATTVNVGNTGTSAFGTVNVGRGATAVFIGDNVASAITLGRTGGSVTLGPPLTLGAAPTTSGHIGYTTLISIPTTLASYVPVTPISIPSAGIWLILYTVRLASIGGAVITRFFTAVNTTVSGSTNAVSIIELSGSYTVNTTASLSNNGSAVVMIPNNTSTCQIQLVLAITSGTVTLDAFSNVILTRIG